MGWKLFHEMKSKGISPDEVTYTTMIGVLCKAPKLTEAAELLDAMDLTRNVPCSYSYNTMIMGYANVGSFDEAYKLLAKCERRVAGPVLWDTRNDFGNNGNA